MRRRGLWFSLLLCGLLMAARPVYATVNYDYIVQPGDTLLSISRRYSVDVETLAAVNSLTSTSWVFSGQKLIIPNTVAPSPDADPVVTGAVYVVQPGDTLITIAVRHGLSLGQLALTNQLNWNSWVYTGQRLAIPGLVADDPDTAAQPAPLPEDGLHTVQSGENLFRIGLKYNTTAAAIKAMNNLTSDVIYVGQRLRIPGSPSSPVPPAPEIDPDVNPQEKWIDVNLSTQTITAYQGQTPVYSTLVSTGLWGTPTVVGTFKIYVKYLSAPMSGPGYYLPNVPHTMYFHAGFALHGAYWHNNFGTPMSHGCVNLSLPDAEWFYNWAPVGTKVVTHY